MNAAMELPTILGCQGNVTKNMQFQMSLCMRIKAMQQIAKRAIETFQVLKKL
jgi:hypothetical protein